MSRSIQGHGNVPFASRIAVRRWCARRDADPPEIPARTRIIAVFSMPSFIAMASAVLKPMPRISRRRYGFSLDCYRAGTLPPGMTSSAIERFLELRRDTKLEERVARGEVVSTSELKKKYSAQAGDVKGLVSWLKDQGYKVTHVTPDNTGVYVEASVDKIAKSLAVNMVRVTKDGLTYTAAQNAPSMPADVAKNVHAIISLQPFRRMQKHFRTCVPKSGNRMGADGAGSPAKGRATKKGAKSKGVLQTMGGAALSPNISNAPPYVVSEIMKAYGADGLNVTGNGQTIAILIDTVPADSDLKLFWKRNGIKRTGQIEKVNVNNVPLPPRREKRHSTWNGRAASPLARRSGSTRPGRCNSWISTARSTGSSRICRARPECDNCRSAWGLGETFLGGPQGEVATQHQKLLRLAAAGVNVFVSTGDAGSNPDNTGHSSGGPLQAEYESSDPCVIAVGGTSLTLTPSGQVADETGWTSGGGGKSICLKRPVWQQGAGMPPDDVRLVPDVSAVADPNTGALLVLHGKGTQIGGTSWSAPIWAGFGAMINEARNKAGKPPLPFLNPLLYPLMGTACFRDVTAGSNGAYKAGPGYDMVTGIGVPNVAQLIRKLT